MMGLHTTTKEDSMSTEDIIIRLFLIVDDRIGPVKKRDDAKGIFEMWKKPVASIKERHGRLKAFSDEVNEACKAGELAFAYWLLTAPDKFNEKLLAPPDVAPVDELQQRLIDAWNAYARTIKEAQDLDGQVKGTEERLKTMRTRLDEAKKKFDARVRAALSKIKQN